MGMKRKKAGFLLKLLVLMLAVYAAVQMVVLQIEYNTQRDQQERLAEQRDDLRQRISALRSYNESIESGSEEAIALVARDLGWCWRDEIVIVNRGR